MDDGCNISSCYNIGTISAEPISVTYLGTGMIGHHLHGTVKNCYYLKTTSELGRGYNKEDENEIIECKTNENMKNKEFVNILNGENDKDIFNYDEDNLNKGYPVLYWQTSTTNNNITEISPTGITLDKTELILKKGERYTLTASIKPSNATDKTVIWSSENNMIATVDDGTITAEKVGIVKIYATTKDKQYYAECMVTVIEEEISNEENDNEEQNGKQEEEYIKDANETIEQTKEDDTTAIGKLPQTGVSATIIISLIAVTIISMVIYKKYNSYKDIK